MLLKVLGGLSAKTEVSLILILEVLFLQLFHQLGTTLWYVDHVYCTCWEGIYHVILLLFHDPVQFLLSHFPTFLTSQWLEYERETCAVPTLRIKPPLLECYLDIPFPKSDDLSPCSECYGNVTKRYCRQNRKHNGAPKTDTYICITMDDTCFAADGNVLEGPFHVQLRSGLPSNSYVYPEKFESSQRGSRCADCKDKSYSLKHCRTRKNHRALPWKTAYASLTLARNAYGSTSAPVSNGWYICENGSVIKDNDVISNAPHPSMTFLAIVSSEKNEAMVCES